MKNYAHESLRSLAFDLDFELGGINLRRETLNDINIVLGHLREDMDNIKEENIRVYFREFHTKIRLIEDLFNYSIRDLNLDFEKVYDIAHVIFDKVVKQSATNNKEGYSTYPFINLPMMSSERENEIAMENNTKAFVHEFGRSPVNAQEVRNWIASVMKSIEENELKSPPPLQ